MDLQDKMARMLTGADDHVRAPARVTTGEVKSRSGDVARCLLAGDVSTLNRVDASGCPCAVGDRLAVVGRPGMWFAFANLTKGPTTVGQSVYVGTAGIDVGVTPASNRYGNAYCLTDGNGVTIGYLRAVSYKDGSIGLQLETRRDGAAGGTAYASAGPQVDADGGMWFAPNATTRLSNAARTVALYPSTSGNLTSPSGGPARVYGVHNLFWNPAGVGADSEHGLAGDLGRYAFAEVFFGTAGGKSSTRVFNPAAASVALSRVTAASDGGDLTVAAATLKFSTSDGASSFRLSKRSARTLAGGGVASSSAALVVYGVWGVMG